MATILPDTHRLITLLKERGFTEEQAEGLTEVIQEIDLSHLTTKGDIRELELRLASQLKELEVRLTARVATFIGIGVALLAALKLFA